MQIQLFSEVGAEGCSHGRGRTQLERFHQRLPELGQLGLCGTDGLRRLSAPLVNNATQRLQPSLR